MELSFLHWLEQLRTPWGNELMRFFTNLVNPHSVTIWVVIGVLLLLFKKTRLCGVQLLLAVFLCDIFTEDILKPLVGRFRPFLTDRLLVPITRPGGYSFPSGHASHSFVAAFTLYLHDKTLGKAALILASCIAFSRLYFSVHYPTDVLAGTLLGILVATGVYYAFLHGEKLVRRIHLPSSQSK